jgi:tetratricopeptide (TPR) repeat protein
MQTPSQTDAAAPLAAPSSAPIALPKLPLFALAAVVLLAAVPYLFGLGGSFVYDDEILILQNPMVQDLARLPDLLTNSLWGFATSPNEARVEYWRPLTSLSFALLWAIGDGAPLVFKLASLVLHLVCVVQVARLGRLLTGRADVALAGALLFGVHPLGVEAVTWISAINDPLMLAFGLTGAISWIGWRRAGSPGLPWRAVLCYAGAVLAKETALGFVLVFVALALTALRGAVAIASRGGQRFVRPALAFGPWLAAYWLMRTLVFGNWHGGLLSQNVYLAASWERLQELRIELLGGGLALAAWPAELTVFRPFRGSVDAGDLAVPLAAIAAAVAIGAVLWKRRDRTALALWAWPLALLAPLVLRVQSVGQFPLSDRFVYGTVPGVALLFALVLFRMGARTKNPVARALPWIATFALAALLGLHGARRTAAWDTPDGFWRAAEAENPNIALVQWNLGRITLEEFRRTPTLPVAERAFEYFTRALDIAEGVAEGIDVPGSQFDRLQSYLGTGWSLLYQGQVDGYGGLDAPLRYFELVIGLQAADEGGEPKPIVPSGETSHEAWTGRGATLAAMARYDDSIASFERAIELYPDYPLAHFNKGLVHFGLGQWIPATNHLDRAVELQPSNPEFALFAAHAAAERAAMGRGSAARARELAELARDNAPDSSGPVVLLGILARRDERPTDSLQLLDEALRIDPSDPDAHLQRGTTLLSMGRDDEALAEYVEACQFGGDRFEPHWRTAVMLLAAKVPNEDVLPYLRRAYELCPDPARLGELGADLDRILPAGDPLRYTMALFDERRGQIDSALYWAQTAAAEADADGRGAYLFGRLLLATDRADDALPWLEMANDRRPDRFELRCELGSARADTGDADGARAAWNRALEVVPPAPAGQEWQEQMLRGQIESGLENLARLEAGAAGPTQDDE